MVKTIKVKISGSAPNRPVLRSITRQCRGIELNRLLSRAVNAFIVIEPNPRAEMLAIVHRPPNRIERRVSVDVIPAQQQNIGGAVTNRRASVADFRPVIFAQPIQQNQAGQNDDASHEPGEPMDISAGSHNTNNASNRTIEMIELAEPMDISGGGDGVNGGSDAGGGDDDGLNTEGNGLIDEQTPPEDGHSHDASDTSIDGTNDDNDITTSAAAFCRSKEQISPSNESVSIGTRRTSDECTSQNGQDHDQTKPESKQTPPESVPSSLIDATANKQNGSNHSVTSQAPSTNDTNDELSQNSQVRSVPTVMNQENRLPNFQQTVSSYPSPPFKIRGRRPSLEVKKMNPIMEQPEDK